ncbi:MAG: CDP-diacylglycerol--glycerol-3-phosphate 3-phosphatidyltransferase [Actinomycetota bacterium]
MSLPNLLTGARVALVPVFFVFAVKAGNGITPQGEMNSASWIAAGVFALASATDYADGYLARRYKSATPLGEWLDPLADKLLVGAALIALVAYRAFPLWAAVVIAVREVIVAVLRSMAIKRDHSMPAAFAGKLKTSVQLAMVLAWLFPRQGVGLVVQDIVLWLAVALTIVSGAQYLAKSRELLSPRAGI